MKVVLLHDWLTGFRGGERILEALCELYPEAPIYTLIHKQGSTSPIIESREIKTSFLNKIPNIHENYRKYLPLMPLAANMLKITHEADLIISSSHCVIKNVPKPSKARHVCYIHSPMRYVYDQFNSYFDHMPLHIRLAAKLIRPYLQFCDKEANNNVDLFIANSNFVAQRVELFYGIKPKIVHPFVDLKDFDKNNSSQIISKENFYLIVSAFAPNKRIDLAIEAFNQLGKNYKLKIIGTGSNQELESIKRKASSNIEFMGNLSRKEVINHFARAKALIFPGIEDFGITPLESLAAGTPVIAYKAAGVLDTLTDLTAHFFEFQTADCLINAIQEFESKSFLSTQLISRAHEFSKEKFLLNIKQHL